MRASCDRLIYLHRINRLLVAPVTTDEIDIARLLLKAYLAHRFPAMRMRLKNTQTSNLEHEEEESEEEIVNRYVKSGLPHQACFLIALFMLSLGLGESARAAGPVFSQDCLFTWKANSEPDLAGYRIYLGRVASLLNRVQDVGNLTSIRCSEVGAASNGQWFGTLTAYDVAGNEGVPIQVIPFELVGFPEPGPLSQVVEPAEIGLIRHLVGFDILAVELTWTDPNLHPVSSRIEVSSSLDPTWTVMAVLPSEVTRFNYFSPSSAAWVCYRVRGESGMNVSLWAQVGGPDDRQFCFAPPQVPSIAQPILASTVFFEPQSVQLTSMQPGFKLTWKNLQIASNRIEVSSSVDVNWRTLMVLQPGLETFTYPLSIDAEWVCMRIRAEQQRVVSLWATAGGPNDRQFCFKPAL